MRAFVTRFAAAFGLVFGLATATPVLAEVPASAEQLAEWVASSGDAEGLPFIVVDKVAAVVAVYDASGVLQGSTPALVGAAPGDDTIPGIGDRELWDIRPEERTTPAGRFHARFGRAVGLGPVLWVDFGSAIALHPTVTTNKAEQRLLRIASPSAEDNRITYGCINVPADFYQHVVRETFGGADGMVYVLPDTRSLAEVFPRFGTVMQASGKPVETVTASARPMATIADYLGSSKPLGAE